MPKKVLIIDDDASLQTVLEIALQQAGFEVVLAGNGEEGIAQVAATHPDAVVSDLMMPQMDGVQFVRTIHEQLQYENIPLIVMTALNRKPWFAESGRRRRDHSAKTVRCPPIRIADPNADRRLATLDLPAVPLILTRPSASKCGLSAA